jgi:hypothetical protein
LGQREKVAGDWRRLHNEELHDFNCSPNITREITSSCVRWVGHVACMGRRVVYTEFWWGKLKKRCYLKKTRHNWEDNIKMYHKNMGYRRLD